jgi:hypothetical protein
LAQSVEQNGKDEVNDLIADNRRPPVLVQDPVITKGFSGRNSNLSPAILNRIKILIERSRRILNIFSVKPFVRSFCRVEMNRIPDTVEMSFPLNKLNKNINL